MLSDTPWSARPKGGARDAATGAAVITPPPLPVSVWATVDLPGVHHWPSAPQHRSYLRTPHRHLFRIRAEVRVGHYDRDVEFHDLQDLICEWWRNEWPELGDVGARSCEDLARDLGYAMIEQGLTVVAVDVSEDNENGATVRFEAAS